MKMKLMAAAGAVALTVASGAAAQVNGLYVAGDVGYHQADLETTSSRNGPAGPVNWSFSPDGQVAGFGRVGFRFSENLRIELEGGYRPGEFDRVSGSTNQIPQSLCTPGPRRGVGGVPTTCGPVDGELNASTLLVNAILDLDFDFGLFGQTLVPFIGVGVGAAEVQNKVFGQLSNVAAAGAAVPLPTAPYQNLVIDDIERTWAAQGIIGLAFQMTPNFTIDLTGRYLRTGDLEFGSISLVDGPQPPGRGSTPTPLGFFEGPYEDASVSIGLRYTFAAPPPVPEPMMPTPEPMMPTPMPEPVPEVRPQPEAPRPVMREFVVYFPFDQSVLTPEAQTVVQEAASYAQQGNATQVQVVGHADTSGSAAYNVRLSERRARAVADAMVGLGVNPGVITADWRGETQPAVQTGDGVREPLNRRTSINVNF
jgi:outer membrane protein OmpA-like peptidoglycan-associated protein